MKLIYSILKNQFLPDLNINSKQMASNFAMIGHFVSSVETIEDDTVFDLEIRQNRGDCLGYYGLARDISVLYHIPLVLPQIPQPQITDYQLPIKVTSTNVKRLTAVKISNINTSPSPEWLKKFLELHNINSINNVVDATNYIMFLWGMPNHAFDIAKSSENLIWEDNQKYSQFTTLDGTTLKLPPQTLIVANPLKPLSLSFIGGQECAIQIDTTDIIIEVATYNRIRVRQDSHFLKTVTEAGIRLEKDLDSESIPLAFNHLAGLILNLCGGTVSSQIFNYYPQPDILPQISLDPTKASSFAGIDIPVNTSLNILNRLGCTIKDGLVAPPSIRKDITIEEDLIEEIIRFNGYGQIPTNQPIPTKQITDITPKILYLIEQIKDQLVRLGYDEIRSWPLVRHCDPDLSGEAISTQNSINSEYPYLRQSIIQSLKSQRDQYQRLKLPQPRFFEIGKIFRKHDGQYTERYSLGIYHHDIDQLIRDLKKLKLNPASTQNNFVEIILDDLPKSAIYRPTNLKNNAVELTSQIITLDANVTSFKKPDELIRDYQSKISANLLWSISMVDHYQDKYTFRVSYYNCDDKTAKKVHLSTFGLTDKQYQYIDPKTETNLLYYTDMYQTEATANIINIKTINNHQYLVFDQTIFFPEGGGQPGDLGTINDTEVIDLKYKDAQVLHQINGDNFEIGDTVKLKINWEHRYKYMKIHSAGHLLHEVIMGVDSSLIPLKGHHYDDAYLIYSGQLDTNLTSRIETRLQKLISEDLPILCDYTDLKTLRNDARSIPDNLPQNKKLRRLKIGNFPSMADGGIQVKSTKEIGQIKTTSIEIIQNQIKISYTVL